MAVAFPKEAILQNVSELTNQNCITIEEARNAIKAKFTNYRQLLDKKELELLSELNQIEETNKPELTHVQYDLKRLRGVVDLLDDSLETNTLKLFLEKQKSIWDEEIRNFERSEKLLSHVTLNFSDFNQFVNKIIELIPFRTKAKFRTDLEPLLKLEPNLGEEWFVVSQKWFSSFAASINLQSPQNYDTWEFPERIPLDNSTIYTNEQIAESACKKLHSKAWGMLLGYHKMSPGSSPIRRVPFFNPQSQKVELPIVPIIHKCFIGYSGTSNFNLQIELKCFPNETYEEILEKICKFSNLFTTFPPQLFCFASNYTVNFQYNKYTISKIFAPMQIQNDEYFGMCSTPVQPLVLFYSLAPLKDLKSQIGLTIKSFLFVIPDSSGVNTIQVVSNLPELKQ